MNGGVLSHEARQELRQVVSARIKAALKPCPANECAGCGCALDDFITGCRTCQARHRARNGYRRTVTKHNSTGYRNGCRCPVCTEANSEYFRAHYVARTKHSTAGRPSAIEAQGPTRKEVNAT